MEKKYQKPAIKVCAMILECDLNQSTTQKIGEGTIDPSDAGAKGAVEWQEYLKED